MEKINEILKNESPKLDKCEFCGKEYKWYVQKVFEGTPKESTFKRQVPACNCFEVQEQRKKDERLARIKKVKLEKLFENSLITPYFQKKTFANLKLKAQEYGNERELKLLQKYANEFNSGVGKAPGIFLTGNPGTGKTSMIAAVCNQLILSGFNCLFITFSALIERFTKYSFDNSGDISPLLIWLTHFDFVVIDDIGRENYTVRRKEIAFRIIDTLLNYEVPTAFTANPEMLAKLGKIEDWDAMLNRLKDICSMQIQFKGKSLRGMSKYGY